MRPVGRAVIGFPRILLTDRNPKPFVAYNAGPRRAKEWIEQYGDPRDPRIDPIDWIERIPISETRNDVQRVLENMQVYRALVENNPKLLIEADLRRGG